MVACYVPFQTGHLGITLPLDMLAMELGAETVRGSLVTIAYGGIA